MTLQWLGQSQVTLYAQHYYRARFLLPLRAPGDTVDTPCPISNTRLFQIKTMLGQLVPGDWTVLKVPAPDYFDKFPPAPWPANMREVPPALNPNGLCPVWAWVRAGKKVTVPLESIRGVLSPLGGILLNFWNQSNGVRIYDASVTSLSPGQILPGGGGVQIGPGMSLLPGGGGSPAPGQPTPSPGQPTPPLPPTPGQVTPGAIIPGAASPGQPLPSPTTSPTPSSPTGVEEKKTSPVVYVVVGALAIGAIALLTSRAA
jgi:hypothetical protein